MLTAITRQISPNINQCELSFHERQPINLERAIDQHGAYEHLLEGLGVRVVSLPAEPDLPDSVFVEDPVVVVEEVAVVSRMGAESRRPEVQTLAAALSSYRRLQFLKQPATLDGGDVLRIGRKLFVGVSRRTNTAGRAQLGELLRPYDYDVRPVEVQGCLHLKSACSFIGENTVLVNRGWMDIRELAGFDLVDVHEDEPAGANALLVNESLIMPASFPRTLALLERRGFRVQTIDVSELQKAESGVTCMSLIFDDLGPPLDSAAGRSTLGG